MTDNSGAISVDDKNVVIIGGTSGIGLEIGRAFARNGADVVASSRSEDSVADAAAELRDLGAETAEVTCNVRDLESIENLKDEAEAALGEIDVLVNSAGSVAAAPVTEMTEDEWFQDIDVCLSGVFRATKVFGAAMDEGSIINISSMSAEQSREERAGYVSAKAGLNGLTRATAADLAPDIRVNAIAPGFVKTELAGPKLEDGSEFREGVDERTSMERVATPDEISGAALYLASDAASFTTGEIITIDGGYDRSSV
ncbi:SDR family NAD(P)-dependent oxidoreductase [Halopiger aswanensis]|uniref:NAD(P)-dependent dehydrogenase (Short-subunit alcohol dehydrogenase family) n=1 Tax=Halopiger aswanensis TaxID=148449 RepID=A0A419WJA4_9EURY|nr:SDR family oxidoreductase [Halopiger aswanensis]RKD95565.1 NAD(P)-dependent dehydrogenase (short-subunit alcohol dehydrogenase family) [Halopiger aswanensis]